MKKYFVALAILLAACQVGLCQKNVDQLFKELSKTEGINSMSIGKFTLKLAGMFTETMGVTGIEIYDLEECEAEAKEKFSNLVKTLKDSDYETLVQSNEDGEQVKILVKIKNDIIREVVVLNTGSDSAMIRIKGKIKPSDIEKVVNEHKK